MFVYVKMSWAINRIIRAIYRVFCDRKRGNGFKLKKERFSQDIRKKFFYNKSGEALIGCPEMWWMPHPWRHSRSGWTGLWAAWSSCRCPCSLQGRWTITFKGLFQFKQLYYLQISRGHGSNSVLMSAAGTWELRSSGPAHGRCILHRGIWMWIKRQCWELRDLSLLGLIAIPSEQACCQQHS